MNEAGTFLPGRFVLRVAGLGDKELVDFEWSTIHFTYSPRCCFCLRGTPQHPANHDASQCPVMGQMNKERAKLRLKAVEVRGGHITIDNTVTPISPEQVGELKGEVGKCKSAISALEKRMDAAESALGKRKPGDDAAPPSSQNVSRSVPARKRSSRRRRQTRRRWKRTARPKRRGTGRRRQRRRQHQ